MDIVTWILFSGIIIFIIGNTIDHIRKPSSQITARKEGKAAATEWDEEYLRTEAKKHAVDRIEPTKYWYKTNRLKTYDGYRFYCTCGHTDYRPSLAWAEIGFEKHQKDMREAALAQLGRFK
jgi:hypothetical protein